jgi:hypothetical protein
MSAFFRPIGKQKEHRFNPLGSHKPVSSHINPTAPEQTVFAPPTNYMIKINISVVLGLDTS